MSKVLLNSLFILLLATIISICDTGCANIIPPGGGARDTIPPVLIASLPKDSATNVNTNRIILTFNEYVEVKDAQQQLIVSPNPKQSPIVDYKLKNVTIKLRDSLEPNTTYSLNFGNAVKDVNEGNVAKNFTYVFSTGNTIDNNSFSGKVILAETGKTDSTLIVTLYNILNDTAVVKTNPRYYARLDNKGRFVFKHLPKGTFNAFVIENGYEKKYNDSLKMFGFLDHTVEVSDSTKAETFYAYQEAKKKEKQGSASSNIGQPRNNKSGDNRLRFTTSLDNGQQDLIKSFQLEFNRQLKKIDSARIILTDTFYKPISGYVFTVDSTKTKITFSYNWKEEKQFRVIIPKDAVADTNNVGLLKSDTLKFITKKETDYGSLRLRFVNIDISKKPVLQFMQQDKIIEAVPLTRNEFNRKLIKPGDYEISILFDTNGNGIWDAGSYKLKRQPEIVQQVPKKVVVKANWENEVTINL